MIRNNESEWDEDFNIDEIFCDESFSQYTDSRQSHPASTSQNVLNISALCCNEEINGFDKLTGSTWIYPTNYPIRDYQFNIIQAAIFKNTLVSLPTGLGKTFIAAVLMYNFYRWYPLGKIVFTAPTRPLVAQQIDACYNIMAIPPDDTIEMTGSMPVNIRKSSWQKKRVFFATPQVIDNDLRAGICPAELIRCLVFDEAHRARGKYAYCQIVTTLNDKKCKTYRLLALSATPGSKVEDVINVVKSLQIAHLELRTEECIDVARYSFSRKIETVVIPLGADLNNLRRQYIEILDVYTRRLRDLNVLSGNAGNLSRGRVLMLYKEFQARDKSSRHPKHNQIMQDFQPLIPLYHCLELLTKHGAWVFLNFFDDRQEKSRITADDRLTILLERLRQDLGTNPLSLNTSTLPDGSVPEIPQDLKFGHPKFDYLRKIIVAHFKEASKEGRETKAIVFCEYRESVNLVNCLLLQCRPLIKPQMFVGQGAGTVSANKDRVKTVSQKQQLRIMKAFREGTCNTLVSTCVGEEGLDVGSVDLIVCFDISTSSPVRLVQRCGRTGRERGGKVFMLVTEGKEHQTLKESMFQRDNLNKRVMRCKELDRNLYKLNPRMLPVDVTPSCHKMFITVKKKEEIPNKPLKGQTDLRSMLVSKKGSDKNSLDWLITKEEYEKLYPDGFKVTHKFAEVKNYWNLSRDEILKEAQTFSEPDPSLVDLSEWLEWQRTVPEAGDTGHSCDSAVLANLLQYADNRRFNLSPSTQCPSYSTQQLSTQVLRLDEKKKTSVKRKAKSKVFKSPTKRDGDIRALFNTATKSTKEYTEIRHEIGLDNEKHSLPNILIDLLVDLSIEKTNRPIYQSCLLEGTALECIRLKDFIKTETTESQLVANINIPDINICDRITKDGLKRFMSSESCISPAMSDDLFFNDDCFPVEEVESQLEVQNDIEINEMNNIQENASPKINIPFATKRSLNCENTTPETINVAKVNNFDVGELDDLFVDSFVETTPDFNQNIDTEKIHKRSIDHMENVEKLDCDEQKMTLDFFGLDSIEDMFADNSDENDERSKEQCLSSVNNKIINSDIDEEPTTPSLLSGNTRKRKCYSICSPILGSQRKKINLSTKKSNDFTLETCSTPIDNSSNIRNKSIRPTSLTKKIKSFSANLNSFNKSPLKDDSNKHIFKTKNNAKCDLTPEISLYTITQIMDMVNNDQTAENTCPATENQETETCKPCVPVNLDDTPDLFSETYDVDSDISCSPVILTQTDKFRASSSKTGKVVGGSQYNNEILSNKTKDSIIIVETSSDSDNTQEYDITDLKIFDQYTKESPKPWPVSQNCSTNIRMEVEQSNVANYNEKPTLELKVSESSNSCVAAKSKLSLRDKLKGIRDKTKCISQPSNKSDNFDTFHVTVDPFTSSRFFNETLSQKENAYPICHKRDMSDDSDLENFSQSIPSIHKLQQFRRSNSLRTKHSQITEQSNVGTPLRKTTASKWLTARTQNTNPIVSSQSDSDDEFIMKPKKVLPLKGQRIEATNILTVRRSPEVKKHLIRKKHKRKPKCQFIEYEAEPDNRHDSGDELTQNGDLDRDLDDFICDEDAGAGASDHNVDMQALYLRSVHDTNRGVFKIPKLQPATFDVLSQAEPYNDTCYQLDSFCVDTSVQLTQNHDLSELEIAERELKKRRKEMKRKKNGKVHMPSTILENSPVIVKPARNVRRVILSDDSD